MSKTFSHVGQHLIIGIAGTELTAATRRLLHTIQPGGVVLFDRNVGSAAELRALTRALRTEFAYRPLVAMDVECRPVNRLRDIIGELPSVAELKKTGTSEAAEDFGRTVGRWLHQFGVDMDFAPVFDLELCDESTDNALRGRCWGRTADEVICWAGAFLEGLEREGVTACAKHFPGLGRATLDSHEKLPTISCSREQLFAEDLRPYRPFLRRLSAVMVGHGRYAAFDQRPASLSPPIMTELLRGTMEYNGLILTDDLEMGAIAEFAPFAQAVTEAVCAGADMILVCHSAEKALVAHEALAKAVASGIVASQQLGESQKRIQRYRDEWLAHKS